MLESRIEDLGAFELPEFSGVRIMMMPVEFSDVEGSMPEHLKHWSKAVQALVDVSGCSEGVGYLTIDEAAVVAGETHRRPGLHVDGVGPDGRAGGWGGGGGGGWGTEGMLIVASHTGCVAYHQDFETWPGPNGDCAALEPECREDAEVVMEGGRLYRLGALTVHRPLELDADVHRQFVRLSNPSDAPWYEGYTENPTGVQPTGPIHAPRTEFMEYRR